MKRKVILISDEPSFIFMMTTIIDQLELNLLTVDKKGNIWQEINEKAPCIVIWDFKDSEEIEKMSEKIYTHLPQNCHLLLFSNALSGLSHFKNGRLHLFEKPFSPSEISRLIKKIIT